MKKNSITIMILLAAFAGSTAVMAQTALPENLPQLLFPRFTKGTVQLKTGQSYSITANYDMVVERMVLAQGDSFILPARPQEIDTLYAGLRKFVPFGESFYEVFCADSIALFKQHKYTASNAGVAGAYGTSSQTSSSYFETNFYENSGTYKLAVPDNSVKLTDEHYYWIRRKGTMEKFINKRQFLKIFKDKEDELKSYMETARTDFKKDEDILNLVRYCNKIYR